MHYLACDFHITIQKCNQFCPTLYYVQKIIVQNMNKIYPNYLVIQDHVFSIISVLHFFLLFILTL